MNILRWPAKMPERDSGRLPEGQDAYSLGKAKVIDPLGACEQTIHVNSLRDGTNCNNETKPARRDSASHHQGGIARVLWRIGTSLSLIAALGACSDRLSAWFSPVFSDAEVEAAPSPGPRVGAGVSGLNYTPHFIGWFRIIGPEGMRGGGPNIMPAPPGGRSGGASQNCCISIPRVWRTGIQVTVYWHVEKIQDGKTPGVVYRATTEVPQYNGEDTAGMWAIFLPDDRVKIMVADGNANGRNSVDARPADDDPFIAHGVLDDEETKGVRAQARIADCASDERDCPPELREKNYESGLCKAGLPCPPTSKKEKNR